MIGRWNVIDPLAELAPSLTPFRYCYNNPINFTDPFGLWEKTKNGYSTDKKEDIERFMDYLSIEKNSNSTNPDFSQMSTFIGGEMEIGGLGTLSDGSKLAKGFSISQQKDFYGGKHWVTDKKSYNNFWHSVQGDLTPDALDPRTLGRNLGGLNYPGPDNPQRYNGQDDFSIKPDLFNAPGYNHDLYYTSLNAAGFKGLSTDERTINADYRFVAQEIGIALYPSFRIPPSQRVLAFLLGTGLGAIALPKTINAGVKMGLKNELPIPFPR